LLQPAIVPVYGGLPPVTLIVAVWLGAEKTIATLAACAVVVFRIDVEVHVDVSACADDVAVDVAVAVGVGVAPVGVAVAVAVAVGVAVATVAGVELLLEHPAPASTAAAIPTLRSSFFMDAC